MSTLQFSLLKREQLLYLIKLVHLKVLDDASKLKDFKVFAQEIHQFLLSSGADRNLAITLTSFLTDAYFKLYSAGGYSFRKMLRTQNISQDNILDIENEHFNSLDKVVLYLA